jgi:hypothetical protein
MNLSNIKNIIKERWKFYIFGYLIGYIVQLVMGGISSWKCLFPIKIMAIATSIMLGNAFYYGSKKMLVFQAMGKSIKSLAIVASVMVVIFLLRVLVLGIFTFDIIPYIDM